ncbi:MAG: family 20 glycosylhydrolase [Bacteroidaceae bacterium]
MKKVFITVATMLLTLGLSAQTNSGESVGIEKNKASIIPYPNELLQTKGVFKITPSTSIYAKGKEARTLAAFFASKINAATGFKVRIVNKPIIGSISLLLSPNIKETEGYELSVTTQSVTATAQTAQGLFYAMQSFMQLLPSAIEGNTTPTHLQWIAPCVEIKDAPRFKYRGVMLDVCRHFMPIEAIKRQIDVLSLFKINNLHWHLTEDQAWRVEIKKYPELTNRNNAGAWRTEGDGSRYGGFYTQDQIKEVVAYARERYINIVPELEIPGHELAAIAAYPWLSCKGDSITPRIIWGVEDIVMCPGKETTFQFLENVIDELVELFPSHYFHIGGDESPRGEWKNCPLCQTRIKELGLKDEPRSPKEAKLQSYVVRRIEQYLNKKGKSIIGWDEILEGGNLNPSAAIMSWRGEDGGIEAARAGHNVIMTPGSQGMYIDFYQGDPHIEPMAIGGYSTLQKVYSYNPTPKVLIEEGKDGFVLGVQTNLWAEYVLNEQMLEHQLYPRTMALAEIGWTQPNKKDFQRFVRKVDNDTYLRLQAHGVKYHIPLPEQPGGSSDVLAFTDSIYTTFSTTRPEQMVYTTNGTEPVPSSTPYTKPLLFTSSTTLKIATLLPCGLLSPVRTIAINKQPYTPVSTSDTLAGKGLNLRIARGNYFRTAELQGVTHWEQKSISDIKEIRSQMEANSNLRNLKNYAAIAEGKVLIPANGIYKFSSNNAEVWIDNELVVSNDQNLVKRNLRGSRSKVLSQGLHTIRILFLGHIGGGWPTYWDDGNVWIQRDGEKKAKRITPEQLYK